MSDPIDALKNLDEGTAGSSLPAAEVRRRGDRLRRRRTTLRIVGAACAVAVVTTGGVVLGNTRPDAAPPPDPVTQGPDESTRPTPAPDDPAAVTAIPAGFPLAEDFPTPAKGSDEQQLAGPGPRVRAFDDLTACKQPAYPTANPVDRLAAVFQQPEDFRARELSTYPDEATAQTVLATLVATYRDCPRLPTNDGYVTHTDVRDSALGEEGYVVVQSYEFDGSPAIGLSEIHAVRVGNALMLSSTSNEGSSAPDAVDAAVAEQTDLAAPVVGAMCVFSRNPCDPEPGFAALLDEAALRDVTGVRKFDAVPNTGEPTLACQADWLRTLSPGTADYRQFEARGGNDSLGAWAGTAVLGFADEAEADAAYDTLTGWLLDCSTQIDDTHRLARAVDSGLGTPHTGEVAGGRYVWRAVRLTAPETCVECDAAWDDHQAVGVNGRRLVLMHVAYGGDMQFLVDESRSPMDELLPVLLDRIRPSAAGG